MPAFVPRSLEPYKKRDQFEKRLLQLQHAVKTDADLLRIAHSAEKVRLAALGLIKARRLTLAHGNREKQLTNLEQEEAIWKSLTLQEIIARFGTQAET